LSRWAEPIVSFAETVDFLGFMKPDVIDGP
jgi:hypothetical protein